MRDDEPPSNVPFAEAVRVWAKIGLLSFGGPAGQIALMHAELVEKRRWIDEARFLHALGYCTLLPGPEAQQLATYVGWLMHRTKGGVVAGALFVLPGFVAMLALSVVYATWGHVAVVAALFFGLKAAVLAIVAHAAQRIGRRVLRSGPQRVVAALAFVALFFFDAPFPAVVLAAALVGLASTRLAPGAFAPAGEADVAAADSVVARMEARGELAHTAPSRRRAAWLVLAYAVLWAGPGVVLALVAGRGSVLVAEAVFFAKAAVVTFGGAYAVLAYVAQQAIGTYHWLAPAEMLDGLGLAETTPGPLIMAVQFVGFLAAYRHPGALPPLAAGVLGALVTVWSTFVPCFFWVFLGAPYVEALRGARRLGAALSGVSAAVVGVIASLSGWFALHVVFGTVTELHAGPVRWLVPRWGTFDVAAAALAAGAMVALFVAKWSPLRTLLVCAALGAAWQLVR